MAEKDFKNIGKSLPAKVAVSVFIGFSVIIGISVILEVVKSFCGPSGCQGWPFVLFLLFPLIIFGVSTLAFRRSRKKNAEAPVKTMAEEKLRTRKRADKALLIFFAVFFLAGSFFLFVFFIHPLWKSLASSDWAETPCLISSSGIKTHADSDGNTYSVDIKYKYRRDGKTFEGAQYDFSPGSGSGAASKQKIAARYKPGSEAVCYVNPRNPEETVLSRELGNEIWLGLIPLFFVIAGLAGIIWALMPKKEKRPAKWKPDSPLDDYASDSGENIIKAENSALKTSSALLFVCLFWNGITGVFIFLGIKEWHERRDFWILLIMTPFVLIGLSLIYGFLRSLLLIAGPFFTIKISSRAPVLGKEVSLSWEKSGIGEIKSLVITLKGTEEERSGDGAASKNVFFSRDIVSLSDISGIDSGTAKFTIPSGSMHSFESRASRIAWCLELKASASNRPKIVLKYPLSALPAQVKAPEPSEKGAAA